MSNWIYNKKFDIAFILAPPFIITLLVVIFKDSLQILQQDYSFWTWLFLIVFIDVAHVYASLFRTYLSPSNFKRNKKLFIKIPLICLLVSSISFFINSKLFWSLLAYIAVYHFIKQQYGFMRLYSKSEKLSKFQLIMDKIVIYTATIYPMIYWFTTSNINFTWFVKDEFISINSDLFKGIITCLYYIVLLIYVLQLVINIKNKKPINFQKHAIIIGTILSWYLGIVYYNNDLIFTLFNVVSHGIPYMALVYISDVKKNKKGFKFFGVINSSIKPVVFILFLLLIAFIEELIWEITHWQENFDFTNEFLVNQKYLWFWIPLLALPQLTHYILDGFIWKKTKQ